MKKVKVYTIIGLSTLAVAGIGYYVWFRIKMKLLDDKVSTLPQAEQVISQVDTSGVVIPNTASTEPELPMPSENLTSEDSGSTEYSNY